MTAASRCPATPACFKRSEHGDTEMSSNGHQTLVRTRLEFSGRVQGVGFRPFIYRLARELEITGFVSNTCTGAALEVQGTKDRVERFLGRVHAELPPQSEISEVTSKPMEPMNEQAFVIRVSDVHGERTGTVLPDLAICPDCQNEIRDSSARRHQYAFTNCTNCGPRYSIIRDVPYDRQNTTMAKFALCPECSAEYSNPEDRRFHAEPIACRRCGPALSWRDKLGVRSGATGDMLRDAAELLRTGGILALKGIGGYQLLVDARNRGAVERLRWLKRREEKPFAIMFPSLEMVADSCFVSEAEASQLGGAAAPIVLLRPQAGCRIVAEVSRGSPWVGAMLPYSPLHLLLLGECDFPVVATSGNLSDEPIAIENDEAHKRIGFIADAFLEHDRPIARPCDDSVVRVSRSGPVVFRRARGYAPLPVRVNSQLRNVLAVGGHQKNAVAIAAGRQVILSQHVGDLDTIEAREAMKAAVEDLCRLFAFVPEVVACDLHPDYASTRYAEHLGLPLIRVQHHHAHVAACAAENRVCTPYLGVAWDGTGFGLDGNVWGGEFFCADETGFQRVAHVRPFRLPGGSAAVRDGCRVAYSLFRDAFQKEVAPASPFEGSEFEVYGALLERGISAPWCTSAGRLFDAAAAISGVRASSAYEGQAAMLFEGAMGAECGDDAYASDLVDSFPIELDWRQMIRDVVQDASLGVSPSVISLKFHNSMAEWICKVAKRVGLGDVVLSGGVFQNGYFTSRVCEALERTGIRVHTHKHVPPNDGGLALGQAVIAGGTEGTCV